MDSDTVRDAQTALAETFDGPRDATAEGVAVLDGFGLVVKVERGALVCSDGLGRHRRERVFARADRQLRRLVIVGRSGMLTLQALRWLDAVGVTVVILDGDQVLSASAPAAHTDARLHRSLAWAPFEPVGLAIARWLIAEKLAGQAAVAADVLGSRPASDTIESLRAALDNAVTIADVRLTEAQAAACYFRAWSDVGIRFARQDLARVRPHWLRPFAGRESPLGSGSNRKAVHPVGAMLNYVAALTEAEAVTAAHTVGLAPDLGIMHTDNAHRASLALDLMEPVRPVFERHVLSLAAEHTFRARDFAETPEGSCRLLAPLTHDLAALMPSLAGSVAPVAERVAAMLGVAGGRPIAARTPLTGANRRLGRLHNPVPPRLPGFGRTCVDCGGAVAGRAQRCSECGRRRQAEAAARASEAAAIAVQRRRADGLAHPGSDAATRARAGRAIAAARARARDEAAVEVGLTWSFYRDAILPSLAAVAPALIAKATGLSPSSASKLKAGRQIAHPRHWPALAALVGVSPDPAREDGP